VSKKKKKRTHTLKKFRRGGQPRSIRDFSRKKLSKNKLIEKHTRYYRMPTVAELKEELKALKVKGISGKNKAELEEMLRTAKGAAGGGGGAAGGGGNALRGPTNDELEALEAKKQRKRLNNDQMRYLTQKLNSPPSENKGTYAVWNYTDDSEGLLGDRTMLETKIDNRKMFISFNRNQNDQEAGSVVLTMGYMNSEKQLPDGKALADIGKRVLEGNNVTFYRPTKPMKAEKAEKAEKAPADAAGGGGGPAPALAEKAAKEKVDDIKYELEKYLYVPLSEIRGKKKAELLELRKDAIATIAGPAGERNRMKNIAMKDILSQVKSGRYSVKMANELLANYFGTSARKYGFKVPTVPDDVAPKKAGKDSPAAGGGGGAETNDEREARFKKKNDEAAKVAKEGKAKEAAAAAGGGGGAAAGGGGGAAPAAASASEKDEAQDKLAKLVNKVVRAARMGRDNDDINEFMKNEVLPALEKYAAFIGDKSAEAIKRNIRTRIADALSEYKADNEPPAQKPANAGVAGGGGGAPQMRMTGEKMLFRKPI
jgi:hypothetical protein